METLSEIAAEIRKYHLCLGCGDPFVTKTLDLHNEATEFYDSHHCLACGEPKLPKNYNFMCGRCIDLWMNYKESHFNRLIRDIDAMAREHIQSVDLRVAFMIGGDMYLEINS